VHLGDSIPRRKVLRKILAAAMGLPLLGGLMAMLRRVQTRQVPSTVSLPAEVPTGLSVAGSVVVQRDLDGPVHAFSGRCTHLGCHLDRVQGDEAVCPCHGSRFRADGTVVKGPATRPLEGLKAEPDKTTGGWIVRVRA
jgi:Rieske Fe-S protein